jgi:hypothetical protein
MSPSKWAFVALVTIGGMLMLRAYNEPRKKIRYILAAISVVIWIAALIVGNAVL